MIAAFITAYAALRLRWIPPGGSGDPGVLAQLKPLARKLIAVLRMTATYDPQGSTLEQTIASVREKMAASSRSRPSTLQLLFSFSRRVKEILANGSRRPRPQPNQNAQATLALTCPDMPVLSAMTLEHRDVTQASDSNPGGPHQGV